MMLEVLLIYIRDVYYIKFYRYAFKLIIFYMNSNIWEPLLCLILAFFCRKFLFRNKDTHILYSYTHALTKFMQVLNEASGI